MLLAVLRDTPLSQGNDASAASPMSDSSGSSVRSTGGGQALSTRSSGGQLAGAGSGMGQANAGPIGAVGAGRGSVESASQFFRGIGLGLLQGTPTGFLRETPWDYRQGAGAFGRAFGLGLAGALGMI